MTDLDDVIGIIGVMFILTSYVLLQSDKMKSTSISYSFLNLVGSILILISLFYNWNLPSVIIEIFWILISLFGLWKHFNVAQEEKK